MHTHITRAHLKGYRNIRNTEANFREGLNIIIGKNGTGKSNFLWLLANCDDEMINDIQISGEIELDNAHLTDEITTNIKIIFSHFINEKHKLEKKIIISSTPFPDVEQKTAFSDMLIPFSIPTALDCFSYPKRLSLTLVNDTDSYKNIIHTNNIVLNNLFYRKRYSNIYTLCIQNLTFEQDIVNILKKYTPIEDIRVEYPMREDEIKYISDTQVSISNLQYGFKNNNEWFKWEELSDGTRRIVWIVLNVLLLQNAFILIEEPELGIHPHQLALLMDFLKDQSQHKQIIITTHSPEVLDILDSNELDRIKVARYDEERKTTIIEGLSDKKIASIQKYIQNTNLLSNYWSNIGLENIKKSF